MSSQQPADKGRIRYTNVPLFPADMPDSERLECLRAIGRRHELQFTDSFAELQRRLVLCDPVALLSAFSFYGDRAPAEDDEEGSEWWLLQHDIELLQALVLRHRPGEFKPSPLYPPDFIVLHLLLQGATESYGFRRLAKLDTSATMEDRQLTRAIETMRMHTEGIRNWGYPQQVFRIAKGIFAKLEDDIEAELGFRVASLVDMFLELVEEIRRRAIAHMEQLRPVWNAGTIEDALREYYEASPGMDGTPEVVGDTVAKRGASLADVKNMIVSHANLRLPSVYTLGIRDFTDAYPGPISGGSMTAILSAWSLSFGELADEDPEHLFLGNPVWTRPLVRLGEGQYLWPIPGLFLSFCLEMIERLVERSPRMLERYYVQRSKYLEEESCRLLASSIPSAQAHRGSLWTDPSDGKEYENDVLLVVDTHCLVVEAKGGRVGDAARRGAAESLGDALEELAVSPSEQARRFAEFLSRCPGVHTFPTRRGVVNSVDTSAVRVYGRLNVVQESVPVLAARWRDLAEAGFIPAAAPPTPTMPLADLEIVLHILGDPASVVHYIIRRGELEEHADICGDELDLLAFYLDSGFNIGEAEFNGTPLFLYGLSAQFDSYFMAEWTREDAPTIGRRLTPLWRDMLARLRQRSPTGWLDLAYHLLCVAYEDQVAFEAEFANSEKAVQSASSDSGCKDMVNLPNGPTQRRVAIVGLAYKGISARTRNERMGEAAKICLDRDAATEAVVIGRDVDAPAYPYSVIGLIRSERSEVAPE